MKNIVLSAVAVLAMSSFAVAGGGVAPIEEPIVVVEEPVVSTGSLYLGLAYGFMNAEIVDTGPSGSGHHTITHTVLDEDFNEIMIQAGYKFNEYVAVEGRYWFGLDTGLDLADDLLDVDSSVDAWGIYIKPMYPVTDAFNVYALLGYAGADLTLDAANYSLTSDSVDGFSWGIGAEFAATDAVGIFVDYVSIYDSDEDFIVNGSDVNTEQTISSVNVGVNYRF